MIDSSFGASELDRFRATFFEECAELIADMELRLGLLLTEIADVEELNAIFRAVHSIKAGAGAFGLKRLVKFTHTFEALLDWLRDGRIIQDERVSLVLVHAGDVLAALVDAAQGNSDLDDSFGTDVADELEGLLEEAQTASELGSGNEFNTVGVKSITPHSVTAPFRYRIRFRPHVELFRHANEPLLLIRELARFGHLETTCDIGSLPTFDAIEPEDSYLSWTFELQTDRSHAAIAEVFEFVDQDCDLEIVCLEQPETFGIFEENIPAGPVLAGTGKGELARKKPIPAASEYSATKAVHAGKPASTASIRVDLARIDRLVNMVGELVITQAMLVQQIVDQGTTNGPQTIQDLAFLTRELQECVMAIRMQPVKSVFQRMPRLVREVAGKLNKQVGLVMSGELTEVDKTVIEELADPLTHMIRNSIDHGIESPEARVAAGKPPEGKITLSAAHVGNHILIHVADDGAGIDRERLLAKAIEKGSISANASLTDEEIDELIFAPGFSTAAQVTDVSGRGVGMDVVRRNINSLGGRIQVQSTRGRGTRFTLIIPLTLAVLDGMIVACGSEKYILPLTSIVESFRPEKNQIRTLAGDGEVTSIRGEYVRLVYLSKTFNVPNAVTLPWQGLVVLVETTSGGRFGIVVDELIGQQQVVIKSMRDNFDPVPGISGATILGNGRVALILDIEQLSSFGARSRSCGCESYAAPSATGFDHRSTQIQPIDLDQAAMPRLAVKTR